MKLHFENFDWETFWDEDYEISTPINVTDEMIIEAENILNYKLPSSYIELIKIKNGGYPLKNLFPTETPKSWSENCIAITRICGVGVDYGIVEYTELMIGEWKYPNIGFVVCSCPSAGHDIVMLDYSTNGKSSEPRVVHVEDGGEITFLADNFELFIKGLTCEI